MQDDNKFDQTGRVFAGTWVRLETRSAQEPTRIGQVVAFIPKRTDGMAHIPEGTPKSHVAFEHRHSDVDRYLIAVPGKGGTRYFAPQAGIVETAAGKMGLGV